MWNDMILSNKFGTACKEDIMGNFKIPINFPLGGGLNVNFLLEYGPLDQELGAFEIRKRL
jgi:hypothetical protein